MAWCSAMGLARAKGNSKPVEAPVLLLLLLIFLLSSSSRDPGPRRRAFLCSLRSGPRVTLARAQAQAQAAVMHTTIANARTSLRARMPAPGPWSGLVWSAALGTGI